jgi:hypothetical protein
VSLEAFAEQVLLDQIQATDIETPAFDKEKAQAAVMRRRLTATPTAFIIFHPHKDGTRNSFFVVSSSQHQGMADRGKEFLEQLAVLNFKIDNPPQMPDFSRLHDLATMHQLTSYDVAYLDLAKRLSLPLATRDGDLDKAAVSEGIEVLGK